ncbi:MAG: low molecular weight phosphatase family protein [bacterium]
MAVILCFVVLALTAMPSLGQQKTREAPARTNAPPTHILFVCTGNFYRSRFAEEYFNYKAKQLGLACRAESRGTIVVPGADPGPPGMSPTTLVKLEERGIKPAGTNRCRMALSTNDISRFDVFVALNGAEQLEAMKRVGYPAQRTISWDIQDGVENVDREFSRLVADLDALLKDCIVP